MLEVLTNFWDWTDPFVALMQMIFRLPDDMMRLSICLIGAYPFIYIHRYYLPSTKARLWYSLLLGLFFVFFCFKWDGLYFVISGILTYVICAVFPVKQSPRIVLILSFAILSYGHWMRYTDMYLKYTVNWCTPFMLFVIKLQSFAWDYQDGQIPPRRPFPEKNRIEKLPNLLDYFSYLFFFAGLLTGPVGGFNDYIAFTDRSLFSKEKNNEIPPSITPALYKIGIMCLGIVGFYGTKLIPESYCGQEEFLDNPLWYRIGYLFLAVEVGFTKYYFAWGNGEAHTILIGAAYNGRDNKGNVLWDRIQMLNLIPFRLANTRFHIQANWNICSGEWLKYYIYLRIPRDIQAKINPVIVTFMISAFWHGFYPGYYLFFMLYAFYYLVEEAIDLNFKRIYLMKDRTTPKNPTIFKFYTVFMTICTWVYINTITITFRLLSWDRTSIAWSGVYYFAHIIAVIVYLVFKFGFKAPKPAIVKKE